MPCSTARLLVCCVLFLVACARAGSPSSSPANGGGTDDAPGPPSNGTCIDGCDPSPKSDSTTDAATNLTDGVPDAATCTPSCSASTCGQSDGCGGTCKCCYQCNLLTVGGVSCQLDTVAANGDGTCPAGYSNPAPDCRPCWDCRVSGGYCPNAGCCGTFTTSGIVNNGCNCATCQGFALDFDHATSCNLAKTWSHSGGPSPNSTCGYPNASLPASCGYYTGDCNCSIARCGGTCAL